MSISSKFSIFSLAFLFCTALHGREVNDSFPTKQELYEKYKREQESKAGCSNKKSHYSSFQRSGEGKLKDAYVEENVEILGKGYLNDVDVMGGVAISGKGYLYNSYVGGAIAIKGKGTLKHVQTEGSIAVNGKGTLKHVIADDVALTGSGVLAQLEAQRLAVSGDTNIRHSMVKKLAEFSGNIDAHGTTFDEVEIRSGARSVTRVCVNDKCTEMVSYSESLHQEDSIAKFDKCTLKSLKVHRHEYATSEPEVEFADTTVNGDIVFVGKAGVVYLKGTCTIGGTVINGTVICK